MDEIQPTPEQCETYYRKIYSYANNEVRTGFKDWMVDEAVREYLDRYFSDVLPYDMVVDPVEVIDDRV